MIAKNETIATPVCPFYHWEQGRDLKCEAVKFSFSSHRSKEKLKEYCCSIKKHKECFLYKILLESYE